MICAYGTCNNPASGQCQQCLAAMCKAHTYSWNGRRLCWDHYSAENQAAEQARIRHAQAEAQEAVRRAEAVERARQEAEGARKRREQYEKEHADDCPTCNGKGSCFYNDKYLDAYDNWRQDRTYETCRDCKGTGKKKNGCYIATACLQGSFSWETLEGLKAWRYTVMEASTCGNTLSNYYRETAPPIAAKIAKRPRLATVLRNGLVKPALVLVKRREQSRIRLVYDIALYLLFLGVLAVGTITTAVGN